MDRGCVADQPQRVAISKINKFAFLPPAAAGRGRHSRGPRKSNPALPSLRVLLILFHFDAKTFYFSAFVFRGRFFSFALITRDGIRFR